MLKSCSYCGRIHKAGEKCPKRKPIDYTKKDELYDFRNTSAWQKKREEIKDRDLHLCQACLLNLPGTLKKFNSESLEVHHIEKLRKKFDNGLDNDNLITLCKLHHKQADSGKIDIKLLKNIAVLNTKNQK